MGIKNLKKYIREKCSACMTTIHISDFSNEKISIDISSFIYKYKVVFRDKWISPFIKLLCCLKENKIHGIFIFDGKPPIEKKIEMEKRKQQKHIQANVTILLVNQYWKNLIE